MLGGGTVIVPCCAVAVNCTGGSPATVAVTVTATVAGLPPVQFTATAQQGTITVPPPSIFPAGIAGAGGSVPAVRRISPNGLASVYGTNFAAPDTPRPVTGADL